MSRAIAMVLLVAAAGLAWSLLAALEAPEPMPSSAAAGASPTLIDLEREAPQAVPALPPREALSETVERPLFRGDRRPESQAAEVAAPVDTGAPVSPVSSVLTGVVIVAGEPVALVRGRAGGATTRARIGDSLDGWEVTRIAPDQMILKRGGSEQVLVLRRFEVVPAPPPPPGTQARRVRRRSDDQGDEQNEENLQDPDAAEDPAAVRRPRRPRQGPRQAARERLERRRSNAVTR